MIPHPDDPRQAPSPGALDPTLTAAARAEALAQRCDQARQHGTTWQACCPAHDDTTPSLSITPTGTKVLLKCHAGCPPHSIVAALGLTMADLFTEPRVSRGRSPQLGRVEAVYSYVDHAGTIVHETVRYRQPDGSKTFRQTQPHPTKPGEVLWHLNGVTRVLYRLPAVLTAIQAGQPVYIVEGEKDADTLGQLGLTATTNPMGAGKWLDSYSATLQGAHCLIVPDNDPPGQAHAAHVARSLSGTAASVTVLLLPDLPDKGDVSDWLTAGGTRAALEALVAAAPAWSPEPTTTAQKPLAPSGTRDPDALPYSDTTNARQFVRDHGSNVRYCYPWESWLVWNGTHWQRDDTGRVMRLAKETVQRLARHVETLDDLSAMRALLAHVKSSLSTSKLKALLENAQSELPLPVLPEALDRDPWLLNCANGTLNLQTGLLQPHRRGDLLTKRLTIAYDETAQCSHWKAFLWQIMGGNQALIDFLQDAVGYSLTGDAREQCLLVLYGKGANGKSTFLEICQALLADYGQSTPSATLLAREAHRHEGIPNDIAKLRGARLVTAVEIGEGKRLNEELVKRLTGQDTMSARFLFAEWFEFKPEFKLWIACNHLPQIRGNDHAIWRRVKCVPFDVVIPDDQQDKTLPATLRAELPGILAWAVRGCRRWQQHGLRTPNEVQAATQQYREEMDDLRTFLTSSCLQGGEYKTSATVLLRAYQRWSGRHDETAKHFAKRLSDLNYESKRITTGMFWLGIGLPASMQGEDTD